ncbi:pilus (MSHA type) biogenesis protein MshL [Uliginosibacterium sp. sgz301328]|uniref:pilus (MSHA type) biogenesis protein MshL n=1 Tax=Uliginosibacterium sp. sgz301328 TaxID=3243764 RepID=UPI00359D8439
MFALARDAKVNVDIHPGLSGAITLNAIDQTLPQLLERIARQVDMRFELDGKNLVVAPDTPFLRTYRVDYVNMARDTSSSVSVATQIATAGAIAGMGASTTSSSDGSGNSSFARIDNVSKNRFWDTLIQNLKDLLRETDKLIPTSIEQVKVSGQGAIAAPATTQTAPPGNKGAAQSPDTALTSKDSVDRPLVTYREAASVIANPETGVVTVRATSRQQEKVQEFLDQVMNSARRQVLIEATIAEVNLSQNYQQGVDWSRINLSGYGFRIVQRATGSISAPTGSIFELGYDSKGGNFSGAIKLLESFGDVKVLSSPKISVLNNQTAVLKVVDNSVYFTLEANISRGSQGTQDLVTYNTTVHTVPIGLVLNVTPQIADSDSVLLNLRPSLSRIIGQALDPNPALKQLDIQNQVPIVRSREIESMMRVSSGNIAVMGGLMEDMLDKTDDTTPVLSSVPVMGTLFQNRNDTKRKTELVIFLRPTVIRDASLTGDYASFRTQLPDDNYFNRSIGPDVVPLPPRESAP